MNDLFQPGLDLSITSISQEECYLGLPESVITSIEQDIQEAHSIVSKASFDLGVILCRVRDKYRHNKHGGFEKCLERRFRFGRTTAYNIIWRYEQFGTVQNFEQLDIALSAQYMLSSPSTPQEARDEAIQRAESGEKITVKTSKEIAEKHKAEIEAEKRKAEEAQEAVRLAQQKLFDEQSKAQTRTRELNQQIQELTEKIKNLSKPDEIIKEVDRPATIALLEKLQAEVKALTVQRDNLSRLAEELSADLDANESKREEEARILRVRQEWQKNTDAMYKNVIRFLGQLPMSLDTRIFESDDWDMLDQVMESFQRGIKECRSVRGNIPHMIIEAR